MRSRIRPALDQGAEAQKILDPEMGPAGRDCDEGIFRRQVGPGNGDVLQPAVIVVEVGAIATRPTDPAINQAELAPAEGMEWMGYPEVPAGFWRSRP